MNAGAMDCSTPGDRRNVAAVAMAAETATGSMAAGPERGPLRLLLPAVVAVPLAIQALGAFTAWNAAWEQAQAEVAHTADAAAEYVRSVLEVQRLQVERANELLRGLSEAEIRARESELHDRLRELLRRAGPEEPTRIYVFGRDATLVVNTDFLPSPPQSYADRDYIRAIRVQDPPRLVLGETQMGRMTQAPFFAVTVRRDNGADPPMLDGFRGAINVSNSPEVVAAGLRRLRGQPGDVLALMREDGSVLARTLELPTPPPWRQATGAEVTRRMAGGDARFVRYGPSPLDGEPRIVAYRRVEGWPAYASTARSRSAVIARWRENVTGLFGFGIPATLALATLTLLVRRAWRVAETARAGLEDRVRERTAELAHRTAELAGSEGRLRLAMEAADLGTWEADFRTGLSTRCSRASSILGLPPGPSTGPLGNWRGRIHADDLPAALAAFEVMRSGRCARYAAEYRLKRDDGRWIWVESRARAVEHDAEGRPVRIAGTFQDVTERREAEARRALLAREVDHRAKNALAVVQAALRLTPRSDPERYATAVEGRVSALARAHTLLAEQRWAGAELRQILQGELAAFLPDGAPAGQPRAELEGPPLQVAAAAAQSLSLALHELATNAIKYGALAAPEGRLRVTWRLDPADGLLVLHWAETGGPRLGTPPTRRGFGSRVIVATVRDQLGGTVEPRWLPDGLQVEMRLPLSRIRADAGTAEATLLAAAD
jgi:PAS domain S-box-containing protein